MPGSREARTQRGNGSFGPVTLRSAYRDGFCSGWLDAMLGQEDVYDLAVDPPWVQYDNGYHDGHRAHKYFRAKMEGRKIERQKAP